jgi:hypothetical protein
MGKEMRERHFISFTQDNTSVFVNLLQICQAVIGVKDGVAVCKLYLSNGETITIDGEGQLDVLARLADLSVALNGEPIPPLKANPEDLADTHTTPPQS